MQLGNEAHLTTWLDFLHNFLLQSRKELPQSQTIYYQFIDKDQRLQKRSNPNARNAKDRKLNPHISDSNNVE